jgi:hypothetical protein
MTATDAGPIDLLDPCLYSGEPWPVCRWLRDEAPGYRDASGSWRVPRHRDVTDTKKNAALCISGSRSRPCSSSGGAGATRSTIGQTVVALATYAGQRDRILNDPSLLSTTAVDEFIRSAGPVLNVHRTVTANHQLQGEERHARILSQKVGLN